MSALGQFMFEALGVVKRHHSPVVSGQLGTRTFTSGRSPDPPKLLLLSGRFTYKCVSFLFSSSVRQLLRRGGAATSRKLGIGCPSATVLIFLPVGDLEHQHDFASF